MQVKKHASEGIHPGFEKARADISRSLKQGCQCPHRKDRRPLIILNKKSSKS